MKKKLFLAAFLFSGFLGYGQNMKLFEDFHTYFAKRNWKKLDELLSYDFQVIDQHKKIVHRKTDYLDYLKNWNGTMGTTWTVLTSSEKEKIVYATEQDADLFLTSFYEDVPVYSFRYEFKENQIFKL